MKKLKLCVCWNCFQIICPHEKAKEPFTLIRPQETDYQVNWSFSIGNSLCNEEFYNKTQRDNFIINTETNSGFSFFSRMINCLIRIKKWKTALKENGTLLAIFLHLNFWGLTSIRMIKLSVFMFYITAHSRDLGTLKLCIEILQCTA